MPPVARRTFVFSLPDGRRVRVFARRLPDGAYRVLAVRPVSSALRMADDPNAPRGGHRSTRRGRGRLSTVHEPAEARRAREQAAARRRAEEIQRRQRAREERARRLATPEAQLLQRELNALRNQIRHAELAGDYGAVAAIQARVHEIAAALARIARGESESEFAALP